MEALHDLYLLIEPDARATSRYPTTSQRSQLAARVGWELQEVRGSWRMKYVAELQNSFSRPRDVLPDNVHLHNVGTHNY